MGACLEPTPDMGPYRVEIRGQSFYLTRIDAPPETRVDRYEAALPAEDVPALLAALDQVTEHPQWPRWESEGRPAEPDTSWTLAPGDTGPAAPADWTATADAGALLLTGPWVLYHEPGHGVLSGEIGYADVDGLRAAVTGQWATSSTVLQGPPGTVRAGTPHPEITMGRATDALLAYGYDLGNPEESGPRGWWSPGQDDPSFLEAAQTRLREAGVTGVEVHTHGAHTHPHYMLTAHTLRARRGYPTPVDVLELIEKQDAEGWDGRLAAALKALGITPPTGAPTWLLAPYAELD